NVHDHGGRTHARTHPHELLTSTDVGTTAAVSERPQFFQRAGEHYRRFLPDGYEHPEGREGVKFQLVASGRYSALEAASLPQRARSFVSRGAAVRGR
ncbi:hypothetical protein ACIO3L_39125, partial [Streptomyces sp. NPDC087437]